MSEPLSGKQEASALGFSSADAYYHWRRRHLRE